MIDKLKGNFTYQLKVDYNVLPIIVSLYSKTTIKYVGLYEQQDVIYTNKGTTETNLSIDSANVASAGILMNLSPDQLTRLSEQKNIPKEELDEIVALETMLLKNNPKYRDSKTLNKKNCQMS